MGDKNLLLVKSIEKFPCIYNYNCIDYSKKEVTDKAWNEIANETKLTVGECREKWKNLRYGFIRSLRPNPDGSFKKKYYLHDDMEFVLPFVKLIPKSSYMPRANLEIDTDEEITDYANENGQSPQFYDYDNMLENAEPLRKRTRQYEPSIKYLQHKTSLDKVNDSRKMFLLSLLPEINELTESQMKCFRRKVLALLDEIVDVPNQFGTNNRMWQTERPQSASSQDNDCIIKSELP
ncbi:unnamed protein product [Diatraea saccharalis]|uniref:Transcription factor Adf-1 n=1 Tax=Diatraea saccharalis TaxID=40085 RepID=A0A9N9WHF0_9NEOP|nr:unnamed protein product [Diatraea saccharalis]